jgi:hypothetical protein
VINWNEWGQIYFLGIGRFLLNSLNIELINVKRSPKWSATSLCLYPYRSIASRAVIDFQSAESRMSLPLAEASGMVALSAFQLTCIRILSLRCQAVFHPFNVLSILSFCCRLLGRFILPVSCSLGIPYRLISFWRGC